MTSERPRRAILLRNNFLPYSETFIHEELKFHERYQMTVLARQHRNQDRFPGHRVVAVERIPDRRRHIASTIYGLTGRSPKLERAVSEGGFSLIHAHFGHNGVYAMGFARRHRIPLVVSLHGRDVTVLMGNDKYHPEWWLYLLGYRRLFEAASLFLAASAELKEIIVRCGCPEEKVVVHRLGVDLSRFAPRTDPPQSASPMALMVGRFVEKKGHEHGIRAVARTREAGIDLRLVILGDGPLKTRYQELIARLGLQGFVEMPGPLPQPDVIERLRCSSVLIAPSVVARNLDRESGLIVAKEAAACGVPVIGSLHGGIPEIIDDGQTGYLVPERDSEAVARRLIEILSDPQKRKNMGAAARAKMEREYDIKGRVRALEEIYDEVVAGRPASKI